MADAYAAKTGNWDKDFSNTNKKEGQKGGNNQEKTEYMDLSKPGKYRVRLVGDYVYFFKHFKPFESPVIVQEEMRKEDPAWVAGFYPSKRYAVNVIDKTNLQEGQVGKLKVLEKGPGVFEGFFTYKDVFKVDPNKQDGPDFLITVTGTGLDTDYKVTHLEKAPITTQERDMIKEKGGLYNIAAIFKTTPLEKIIQMWENLPAERKIKPKKEDKGGGGSNRGERSERNDRSNTVADSTKVSDNTSSSPADSGDDLFTNDGTEKQGAELF